MLFALYSGKGGRSKMKMALTVWEDRISPVFDSAQMLLIAEIENKEVTKRRYEPFVPDLPSRMADRLSELDVAVLICGAISELPANIIEATGIELIPFITGSADKVLDLYARGIKITPAFLMPGCGRKRRKRGGGCERCNARFFQTREVSFMPGGNKTGPQGQGPRTGKGQGGCNKGGGRGNSGQGRGGGQGQGQGQGKGGRR
jgi:predicted Fe-Mo cluster-binding NifX family protein